MADAILEPGASSRAREMALRLVARAKTRQPPAAWRKAVATALREPDRLPQAIAAARELPTKAAPNDSLHSALLLIADDSHQPAETRVAALAVVATSLPALSDPHFELLLSGLSDDDSLTLRSVAADGLSNAYLTVAQLQQLCESLTSAGPLELNKLLAPFKHASDEQLGSTLVISLQRSTALPSLRIDLLREVLSGYGPRVRDAIDELEAQVNVDAAAQRQRLEELLPLMADGDVRRGHAVFHSSKAACSACHRLDHAGGTAGPDLTRIGESRSERDLLESILYPSLSFVRGYEPVLIITVDGRAINGTVRDETATEYIITTGPDEEVRIPRDGVEQIEQSNVSIMPAGLVQQLTIEQLADLVTFLKNATAKRDGQ